MSHVWLPRSKRAVQKGEEERTEAEQSVQQAQLNEGGTTDDPNSELSAKLRQKAQVWKTYLKETDRWDKEMVEERNKWAHRLPTVEIANFERFDWDSSLDVMLMDYFVMDKFQAALFSAISTTFLAESLSDLKPDYVKSSAETLLMISNTLSSMAGNQSISALNLNVLAAPASQISPTSLLVNVLWVLSLSLSVAVSLIAMLAKDWCYKFMFGRSGQAYDQARRRQQRWNGMEKWKMKEFLTFLPGMMHMALALFAIGLCVYLWDIDTRVAIPVIIITASVTVVYVAVTLLPLVDQDCPYSTSTTAILIATKPVLSFLLDALVMVVVVLVFLVFLLLACLIPNKWLEKAEKSAQETAHEAIGGMQATLGFENDRSVFQTAEVPMDMVTSQMIAWLITNCEDSRSVDIALQAIAGGNFNLPYEPLVQCGARELVIQRLRACTQWDHESNRVLVKELPMMPQALAYCGAYGLLVSSDRYQSDRDLWNLNADEQKNLTGRGYEDLSMMKVVTELLQQAMQESKSFRSLTPNLLAAIAAAAMPFCHWDWSPSLESDNRYIAPKIAATILDQHLHVDDIVISASTLYALVKSTSHYLVSIWAKEEEHDSQSLLPMQIVEIYAVSHDAAPDTARAAAVVLAAVALATNSYPGGQGPSHTIDAREKRARDLLDYYHANKPTDEVATSLFIFGFVGLLPRLSVGGLGVLPTPESNTFNRIKRYIAALHDFKGQIQIHTLPANYPLLDHAIDSAVQCITSVGSPKFSLHDEPTVVLACSSLLLPKQDLYEAHSHLYGTAAVALCRAKSMELRDICMKILDSQRLPVDPLQPLILSSGTNFLEQMCRILPETSVSVVPVALLHFRLLLASIMLSTQHSLDERRSVLEPLLSCHPEFAGLRPPDVTLSSQSISTDRIFLHLEAVIDEESALDGLLRSMQLVSDFCHVEPDLHMPHEKGSTEDLTYYHTRLQRLKDDHKQSTANDEIISLPDAGRSIVHEELTKEKATSSKQVTARVVDPGSTKEVRKAK
ncbi:hypothetical protein FRC07_002005 [Ceratobasidium sp. 392]|nr:hypothetical protein FRC07_002005 [Ceratobasidium sp. 392]